MKRQFVFVLRLQDTDMVVSTKRYLNIGQAMAGFQKCAHNELGEFCQWYAVPNRLYGGYYRNPRGDVLEMLEMR